MRAAEHQQHPRVVGEAEMRARLRSQCGAVQRGDGRADRHTDHFGARQAGIGDRRQHPLGAARANPVGQPGAGVGFVDHHRHAPPPPGRATGGQIRRQRHVSTEADHDVGLDFVQHRTGLQDGTEYPQRQAGQIAGGFAGQGHRGDQLKRVTALGHQLGLQTTRGAQRGDPDLRIKGDQGVGDGHRGFDVACCTAAREHHRQRGVPGWLPDRVVHPWR